MYDRLIFNICRASVAAVWIYHGLVPKLIVRHPDEALMLTNVGIGEPTAWTLVTIAGFGEIAFGIVVLLFAHQRWPLWLTIAGMIGFTLGVAFTSPEYLVSAFNILDLNVQMALLAAIGLLALTSSKAASQAGLQ